MSKGRKASNSLDPRPDDDLVAGALAGDERAWSEIVDRYGAYVLAVTARGFGIVGLAAEEVFQDVCVRLYDGLAGYSGRGEFRSWLRAVTLSACREHLRQSSRHNDTTVDPPPADMLDALEAAMDLRASVRALGEPCRTTIELHFFADLTQAEVARRLKTPPGTIAARVSRCLRRLRDGLQEAVTPGASRE